MIIAGMIRILPQYENMYVLFAMAAFADATGTFRNCRWEGNRLGAVAAELGAEVERL